MNRAAAIKAVIATLFVIAVFILPPLAEIVGKMFVVFAIGGLIFLLTFMFYMFFSGEFND